MKWILALSLLFLTSCQTNMLRQYDRVQVGMDKDDVLELMGNPQHKIRWKGKDRWTYTFYNDSQFFKKEVHFETGRVVYTGEPHQDTPTAAEQDAMNEKENAELDKQAKAKKIEAQQAFQKYEEKEKGESPKARVPVFKPVQ